MWVIMGSQTHCQEKETSLTTSQYDHSFKCFNDKDVSFILINADFLCYTFPLPHLVMLCGYHYENEPRGADKKTTELASCFCKGGTYYFPALSPSLSASGSWTSYVPYASFPSSSPACTKSLFTWDDLTHSTPTGLLVFFGRLNFLHSYWVSSVLTRLCWVLVLVQKWEEYELPF